MSHSTVGKEGHRFELQLAYACAKLLMDSLKLFDNSVMTDQQIIDIMYNVKSIAIDIEHFPVNPFVDNGKDMKVEEFVKEWKRLFKFAQFDTEARGHFFTSLGGKIGCAAKCCN